MPEMAGINNPGVLFQKLGRGTNVHTLNILFLGNPSQKITPVRNKHTGEAKVSQCRCRRRQEDSKSVPFWYHVPLWYHYKFDADIFLLY